MASGRNNAARKYEDQVPAQREVQPKRHLQVAAAPVKKKKHRRKPAVMQGVYPCIFLVAITAAFILFCQMQLTQLTAEASEQSDPAQRAAVGECFSDDQADEQHEHG